MAINPHIQSAVVDCTTPAAIIAGTANTGNEDKNCKTFDIFVHVTIAPTGGGGSPSISPEFHVSQDGSTNWQLAVAGTPMTAIGWMYFHVAGIVAPYWRLYGNTTAGAFTGVQADVYYVDTVQRTV